MVSFNLDKLREQLENLKQLPNIKEVVALRKRLQKEQKRITKPVTPKITIPEVDANVKRSTKLQRYWRYVKLIRDNFPNLKTNVIRKQLKERQQGQKVEIPDAVWQNPSP